MERILALQHVPHETPGRFLELAQENGIPLDVIRVWERGGLPGFEKYTRLLVMGGPQSVYEPPEQYPSKESEVRAIREFAGAGKPVLGICLGSQLIAHALGGRVQPNRKGGTRWKETGIYPVQLTREGKGSPLFKGFPGRFPVFQWHGDVFDIPPGASLLASGAVRNQAFSHGKAYGTLFHLEMSLPIVEELMMTDRAWLHAENEADEAELTGQFARHQRQLYGLCGKLFENWMQIGPEP